MDLPNDTLHIGPDGQLYYTEQHTESDMSSEFCIDTVEKKATLNDGVKDFWWGLLKKPTSGVVYCGEYMKKCCKIGQSINIK